MGNFAQMTEDENLTFYLLKFGSNTGLIREQWERSEITLTTEERLTLGRLLKMSDEDLLHYKAVYVNAKLKGELF